jgi:hypothetical protein
MAEASALHGRPITTATYIFDLADLSLAPHSVAIAVFKTTIAIDQAYFPERLHQAFFINSPWIFQGLWAIISPLMDPVTKAKFRILGTSYREELLKHIAPECLPVEYGGSCVCGQTEEAGHPPAPTCVSAVCTMSTAEMLTYAGYETITVAAGSEVSRRFICYVADGTWVFWRCGQQRRRVLPAVCAGGP